jgi:Fe-Mn family superoxide dismutase
MKKLILFCLFVSFLNLRSGGWAKEPSQEIPLPPLPYKENALEPYISKRTLFFHYGKHHKDYVKKTNKLAKEKGLVGLSLEDLIKKSANEPELKPLFNAAAQVWNHTFYWSSMKENGGGEPKGPLSELIKKSFGSYAEFKKQFRETGTNLFGSGWVWLLLDKDNTLKILGTKDADLPLIHGQKALLVCDIWEHAYYLDYQNRRKDYVQIFLDHLVNWDFANHNYTGEKNEYSH